MKQIKIVLLFLSVFSLAAQGQRQKVQNQPYADQKLYHLGFFIGMHGQDLIMKHTGAETATGERWFAEIPSYTVGFSVGIIGDRYLNEYMNLRVLPTLHFGEKGYVFKEQYTGEEYRTTIRNNSLSVPLHLKFSATRTGNYRPYMVAGGYASMDIAPRKDMALRFEKMDYGLEIGVGCNIYMPLFKLCPELKFSFGLKDLINKDRSDLSDKELLKYTNAIASGKSRMISLIFNFE